MLSFEPATVFSSRHLADIFSTAPMRAIFGESNSLASMLLVETALARVQGQLGVIPAEAAAAITSAARAERLDLDELAAGTLRAGLPVVNLVEQLIRLTGNPHGEFVHWGATSQDIMDTALVMQIHDALELVERDLESLISAITELARTHRDTPMVGRTKLQHAIPITFGFKVSIWLSGLLRHRERLAELRPRVLQVQFGGAVGTFASLGDDGDRVRAGLARELGLAEPLVAWHAARDALAETVCLLGLISTSLSKIATDVVLMAQTEVGEVLEPGGQGHGGSSTMPHKRNPIICEQILSTGSALRRLASAMLDASVHDHERATGPWQAEWLLLPEAFMLIARALGNAIRLCTGLVVRPDAMQANLGRTQGLIAAEAVMMVLAPHVGRHHAHEMVGAACTHAIASGLTLAQSLARDPAVTAHLAPHEIEAAADPARYVGLSGREVDRVLAASADRPGRALPEPKRSGTP
ncbi:3-carboxy-cis,cis-muconate cycloisomerase [Bradyrhizobium sp. CCBAU 11386]|uniref:3-carboxy-cis,cis-muconate cycloisomerase n=1 Tax=Bradyrhizobium sp. CCBAU 11386 TaxID=1630837 RepID=UPI002303EAE7|nr:3-carboxy-cis,cis-muconate cycloisomerase [Bradyrhizobium sp. CCBAU 11386]MDA9509301.1 3-carboxy-cis,cis-muconate cycloisomerase [Bradyrhizobium sp. CCBAU 11386]